MIIQLNRDKLLTIVKRMYCNNSYIYYNTFIGFSIVKNAEALCYTLSSSTILVNITMVDTFCSQIILQKSLTVLFIGPCAAMYALDSSKP